MQFVIELPPEPLNDPFIWKEQSEIWTKVNFTLDSWNYWMRPSIMCSIIYYAAVLMTRITRRRTSVARDRMIVSNRDSSSSSPIFFDHHPFLRSFFTKYSMLNSTPCWFSLKAAVCRWFSRVFSFLFSFTQVEENLILKIWNGWIVCQIVLIMTRRYMCIWWPATYNYPVFCLLPNPIYSRLEPPMCFPLFVRPFVSRPSALWLWAL